MINKGTKIRFFAAKAKPRIHFGLLGTGEGVIMVNPVKNFMAEENIWKS
jgi:hypothetical protein